MRSSGILMPVFSLDSPYGIGTFGESAKKFVDFLKNAGQSYWQILPLNPTNYGDSPYQSFSSAAGNPYFIDLDILRQEGLLEKSDYEKIDFGSKETSVDYAKLYDNRIPVLKKAFVRFDRNENEYKKFCENEAEWLEDYALFMALKEENGNKPWREWEQNICRRNADAIENATQRLSGVIEFYKFIQYEFSKQWTELKKYANKNGIKIIGDMPIYVADDSVDVWADTKQFLLDDDLYPRVVAGVPPDAFSAEGQLWGSPVYNWDYMKSCDEPFSWWRKRIRRAFGIYDVLRIDHFRGFESYYCIPYGEKTAKKGVWRKGPGNELFDYIKKDLGQDVPIIAEDLGLLTPAVRKLLDDTDFPGMKVLQFAFSTDEESSYLPHNHIKNCVVYTGTHDNDTVIGWAKSAEKSEVEYARRYLHVDDNEGFNWAMIRAALSSVADTAVIMMPDFMGLDTEARINTPSTLGGNWCWRIGKGCVNDWLAKIIYDNTAVYSRLPKKPSVNK